MVVCFNDENKACELSGKHEFMGLQLGSKEKRELSVLTFEDLNAQPGASFQVTIPCRHSFFTGASALAAQYASDTGEEITNPLAETWQELALGSPTHILD